MQCNIDAKGKAVRLVAGSGMVVIALALSILVLLDILGPAWGWAAAGLGGCGAFGVFEARTGWCVVRAMGFRTPL